MSVLSDIEFGLSVLSKFPPDESVVFSPASCSLALALIHSGASGKTKKEIRKILVGDSTSAKLRSFYKSLAASLTEKSDCLLKLGTQLFVEYDLVSGHYNEANKSFKSVEKFEAHIKSCGRFFDPLELAWELNYFISDVTEGAITTCVDPRGSAHSELNAIKHITSLLVNIIYFEGKWKDEFYGNEVSSGDFYVKEGILNKIDFLAQSDVKRLYSETEDVEVLTLPYQDNKYTFTVILPKKRFGLKEVRTGLTGKRLQELLSSVKETHMDVLVPKFTLEMETDATKILKALGVTRAFAEGAELKKYVKNLWINRIHHIARIEINENGSKAGNVTFSKEGTSGDTKAQERAKFVADHPFLFFIRRKDTVIFSGQYFGPKKESWEPESYEPVDLRSIHLNSNEMSDYKFHLSFLKQLPSHRSVVLSPTSIAFALALVHAGAKEHVKHEIRKTLLGEVSDEELITYYRFVYASFREKSNTVLRIANRIFIRDGFEVTNSYSSNIAKNFAAEARNLNFNDAEGSATYVNDFVEKITEGMIPQCVDPSDFGGEANALLTSVIYFQGTWAKRFINHGATFTFHVTYGVEKEIEFLSDHDERKLYGSTEEAQVLTLLYTDNKYSFTIILPKKMFGLDALRDRLTKDKLQEFFRCVEVARIDMLFPKFKIESEPDTTKILKNLGITSMFGKEADLEGIAPNVWISEIKHKAIIEVNENGTRAAGLTYPRGCGYAGSDEVVKARFEANHPFLYFIRCEDKILFSGQFCG